MGSSASKKKEEEERRQEEERLRQLREQHRLEEEARSRLRRLELLRQLELLRLQEEQQREDARREQQRREAIRREEQRREEVQWQLFVKTLIQCKVTRNLSVINDLRQAFGLSLLDYYPTSPYTEDKLSKTSEEYNTVWRIFRRSNKPFFNVTQIIKIDNPFLLLQNKMAKKKYIKIHDEHYCEQIMFHGTKSEYLKSICSLNFGRSKVVNHKFGRGVSFATNSFYATHYHRDNMRTMQKVMVLAKVFYEDTDYLEVGGLYTVIPEEPYYTTRNEDGSVYVKYDDASFYPAYILHYEGLHPSKKR